AGPLPATGRISPLLDSLGPIRDKVVTLDGIDNVLRAATGDADGHASAAATCFTCALPNPDLSASGPSIDYVVGTRLRANSTNIPSYVFAQDYTFYEDKTLFGPNGSPAYLVPFWPDDAAQALFASVQTPDQTPPPAPTLRDRLTSRRTNILDNVAKE